MRIVTTLSRAPGPFPFSIKVQVANVGQTPLPITKVVLGNFSLDRMDVGAQGRDIFAYKHHRIACGTAGICNLTEGGTPLFGEYGDWKDRIPARLRKTWTYNDDSWLVTALFPRGTKRGVFMGFAVKHRHPSRFCFDRGRVQAVNDFFGDVKPGEQLETETLLLCFADDLTHTFSAYGRQTGWANPRRFNEPFIGWNSWEWFFTGIDQQDVENTLRFIQRDTLLSRTLKWIVIDDGWQVARGDWVGNAKFCHDMGDIARRIKQAGFNAGIWVAPFLVDPASSLAGKIPGALIRSENGGVMLDPTHPDGARELSSIFTRLRRQGFSFYKLDFLTGFPERTADGGAPFHRRGCSKEMAIAEGFKTIRRAIGPDAAILGCCNTLGAFAHSDTERTAGDVHPYWSSILQVGRIAAHQYWLHRNWWFNDMDFLLVRSKDTVEKNIHEWYVANKLSRGWGGIKPYRPFVTHTGPLMNINESRVLASIILLSGGNVFLSENLMNLNAEGMDIIHKVLRHHNGRAAIPVDFLETPMPEIWVRRDGRSDLIGVFNWSDRPRRRTLSWGRLGRRPPKRVLELWSEKERPAGNSLRVNLPPRSCHVFKTV